MSILQSLHQKGLYRGYDRHILQMEPILLAMAQRGMPIARARYEEVKRTLEIEVAKLSDEMNALIPPEVRTYAPKEGYKKEPKDKTGLMLLPNGRFARPLPWAPSNKGLTRYMKHRGHKVPTDFKSGKETTGELELKRLARQTDDPLYWKVLAYKKLSTVLDNHIPGWTPSADDRVHSTFYFDPATGQLSSRRPNLQNAPKHPPKDIKGLIINPADLFRSMVEARPGHILLEFDFKSFHAQTLAFEAQDPDYLRLAKLDIHSFVTAHLIKDADANRCIAWDDATLGAYLARIKKAHKFDRDFKAKRAILGYGFGMGWRKLYELNKEYFSSQTEAKRVTEMLDYLFPKCKKWRDAIRWQAHEQGYLISRHGYIRYFWEVFRLKYKGGSVQASPGDDSEAAIAFLPANDAFGEIKDRMLTLDRLGLLGVFGLINQIHDALVFECPLDMEDSALEAVPHIMSSASTVLIDPVVAPNGLSVEVSVLRGQRWNQMEEIDVDKRTIVSA